MLLMYNINMSQEEHLKQAEFERRQNACLSFAREEAAKAWCTAKTSHKQMDVDLAFAFAEILVSHMYEPHLGCCTTQDLIDEINARNGNYRTCEPYVTKRMKFFKTKKVKKTS
jgi:hypothetical protein